ncbi:MAG TPA: metal ABC transporter permease [Hyphomicrobiaceae bacterium]|nr:metal ABC transporter permease [Hyphomicrobiaceae bacterium]
MLEPFFLRALLAGIGLGIIAAPLGCLVVWRRMSYFGSTVAHGALLGVALGLLLEIDLTLGVIVVSLAIGALLVVLQRQSMLPVDSLLGILSHAALAAGLVAAAKLSGQRLDLMGYLFGDIFAVTNTDLMWMLIGGAGVLILVASLWRTLVSIAVHEELAAAEGLNTRRAEAALIIMLAFTIAVAMKIVGVLLIIAFLLMPAAAARPFAQTPEAMVGLAALIGVAGAAGGMFLSSTYDIAGGPSIVLVLSAIATFSLGRAVFAGSR